jgi:hypothetical protein
MAFEMVQAVPHVVVEEVPRPDSLRPAFDTSLIEPRGRTVIISLFALGPKEKEVFRSLLLIGRDIQQSQQAINRGRIRRHSGCPLAELVFRMNCLRIAVQLYVI